MRQSHKPVLCVDFVDFGTRLSKRNNFFTRILENKFDLRITDRPDLLIHSHDGNVHRMYKCKKVFHTVEPYYPNFRESDYSLTFHELPDPRNLRLPNYATKMNAEWLIKKAGETEIIANQKRKFCSFFASYADTKTQHRINFFHKLCRYKRVDSCGKWNNTIGRSVPFDISQKIGFLSQYKFYMAFENQSLPGYTTEKIAEAMAARCIPIYWGNPEVARDFNPQSFLNYHDFPDEASLIERVVEIDNNEDLYRRYLAEPFFVDNKPNIYFNEKRLVDFFAAAVDDNAVSASKAAHFFFFGRRLLVKRNKPNRLSLSNHRSG